MKILLPIKHFFRDVLYRILKFIFKGCCIYTRFWGFNIYEIVSTISLLAEIIDIHREQLKNSFETVKH